MKKLLASGTVLTGVLIAWGCGKAEPPVQPTGAPKTPVQSTGREHLRSAPGDTETPKVETTATTNEAPKPAEAVKIPVLPHTISDAEVGKKAVCPVMGTEVTVTKNTLSAEYKGKVYYFCCGDCPGPFKANPEKYAK